MDKNNLNKILNDELELIRQKPGKENVQADNLIGLSLSGGGIRSASFALGMIHSLVGKDRLKEIDYLSTVSGGGFTGSALMYALNNNKAEGQSLLSKEAFPLGQPDKGSENSKVNNLLNFIRQHADYPCPGKGLNGLSFFATFLRGAVLGNLIYFPLLILLLHLTQPWNIAHLYIEISAGIATLFGVVSILLSLMTYFFYRFYTNKKGLPHGATFAYAFRTSCQRWLGRFLIFIALFLLLWSLKPVSEYLDQLTIKKLTATLSTLIGYIGSYVTSKKNQKRGTPSSLMIALIGTLFAFLVFYGLSLFAYMVADTYPSLVWYLFGGSIILGFFSNINMNGLHQMYRDRIMETFMPNKAAYETNQWQMATEANTFPLHALSDPNLPGPYPLLCATVLLYNSNNPGFRGRGGDCFFFSPIYCGSYATGYQKTELYMKGSLDLSTAVAMSAACVDPYAPQTPGNIIQNPLIAFIMTLLNTQLAYWIPNPGLKCTSTKNWTPNYLFPGLCSLLGMGYQEKSPFVNIADGGEFENLAVYELIRRNVKIIILANGSDGFYYLDNLIEKVRVDFGVNILFDIPEYDLRWIFPNSRHPTPFQKEYGLSKRGFAIGTIYYPNGTQGKLFYVTPTMTETTPAGLFSFQSGNPSFPNTSTADQFFNEDLFEAFREMGYRLTNDLLDTLDSNWDLIKEQPQ